MRSANRFLERFNSGERPASNQPERTQDGPGQRIVRVHGYEIEKLIAFGGQGTVYKARQKATGRNVAIKVPIGDTQRRPSTRYRFQREIELTARLDHPGIVRVFGDCELDDGRIGCVMEFVEGEPFDRWAAKQRVNGRAGTRRIIEVMSLVVDALAYAHQRAVMHRDLKPSNVIVTAEDLPRVLDFGLAKALDESRKSFATLTARSSARWCTPRRSRSATGMTRAICGPMSTLSAFCCSRL
ncbi:MAG: serine/threonine protein kinase [Phycisphaerales bacterium]|nr:serine/threonine protein kinase [Phycisphaerales bacterium]